ncbi:MAG: UbiA prenyltransferase family protein [Planctomycetes bacterium]|nr:UbiA prenyltransferase family protein [Planctomycetota bacterium]
MNRSLIRLMRPGDWVKNVFVLPALFFALPSLLEQGQAIAPLALRTVIAFVAFSLLASGFYAFNDIVDVESDRAHPVKRRRPIASGSVSVRQAAILSVVLITLALVIAGLVNLMLLSTLLVYAGLQVAYDLGVKRVMIVDVVVVAVGFALRATAGAAAISVPISVWLLLCVFFLCAFLGFIKRLCDLASAEAEGGAWHSPAGYDDRNELNWLLGISAALAIVTYLMYTLSPHAWELFGPRSTGFALLSPLAMISIHRFYRRALRGRSDSPLDALREDRAVMACIVLFSVGVLVSLYAPGVEDILAKLFAAGTSASAG